MLRCAQLPRVNVLPMYASARQFIARLASLDLFEQPARSFFGSLSQAAEKARMQACRNCFVFQVPGFGFKLETRNSELQAAYAHMLFCGSLTQTAQKDPEARRAKIDKRRRTLVR
jgi:hypothetical protein